MSNRSTASEIGRCEALFGSSSQFESVKINYRTIRMSLGDSSDRSNWTSSNRYTLQLGVGPEHHRLEGGIIPLVRTNYDLVKTFNLNLKSANRPRAPFKGGQKGQTNLEQWFHYIFENMPSVLSDPNLADRAGLNEMERFILFRVQEILKLGVSLKFVTKDEVQFDVADEVHRIAVTSGKIGDPIYLNAYAFTLFNPDSWVYRSGAEEIPAFLTTPDGERIEKPNLSPIVVTGNRDAAKILSEADLVPTFKTLFSILLHELGHYSGLKDTPERPLDQFSAKISNYFFRQVEIFKMPQEFSQTLHVQIFPIKKGLANQQLLLFDFGFTIDLTERIVEFIQDQIQKDIESISFVDISWESDHSWDSYVWGYSRALMLTAQVKNKNGSVQNLRLRLPIDISISESNAFDSRREQVAGFPENVLTFDERNMKTAPVRLAVEEDIARIFIQKREPEVGSSGVAFRMLDFMSSHKSIKPGNTWKVQIVIDSEVNLTNARAIARITSDDLVWSSVHKRHSESIKVSRVDRISQNQYLVTLEHRFNEDLISSRWRIDQVQFLTASGLFKMRPSRRIEVLVEGFRQTDTSKKAELLFYGYRGLMIEPQNASKLKMPINVDSRPGAIIEMPLFFKNLKSVLRAEVSMLVKYKDKSNEAEIESFVIDPFKAGSNSILRLFGRDIIPAEQVPMGESFGGWPIDVIQLGFTTPKTINGKEVEWIRLERIYILFSDYDQIFEPIKNTINVK